MQEFKKKLTIEVQNATNHLKGSYFDDSKNESKNKSKTINKDIESLLNRKVDLQDFQDQLSSKTDKNAFIMMNE